MINDNSIPHITRYQQPDCNNRDPYQRLYDVIQIACSPPGSDVSTAPLRVANVLEAFSDAAQHSGGLALECELLAVRARSDWGRRDAQRLRTVLLSDARRMEGIK